MPGELFTAADIRRLAHEQKASLLVLGARDLITPEATDVARQVGIQLVREEKPVASSETAPATRAANMRLPPLKLARRSETTLQPFGAGARGVSVALADVVAEADGSPMAAGYMALDATQPGGGVFAWTLTYDEVDIVLEGELVITRGDEQVLGRTGDVIFIAKGSSITFGTPSSTRFVYVAYPVNWADVGK
jgi:ethanolamine utilization protein EutQ